MPDIKSVTQYLIYQLFYAIQYRVFLFFRVAVPVDNFIGEAFTPTTNWIPDGGRGAYPDTWCLNFIRTQSAPCLLNKVGRSLTATLRAAGIVLQFTIE